MKQSTHIVAILDKSGSMKSVWEDTIGGYNTFLEEQKKVPGKKTITLVQFSSGCETTYSDIPLEHVANLTKETYCPSGWTALNDSIAKTINNVGYKMAGLPENERPSKIIVLIMTDGQENWSKEFSGQLGLKRVGEMVKHQQEKYSWSFVFVGSNIDSFSTASGYGIHSTHAINYVSTPAGTYNAFKSMSRGVAASILSADNGTSMESFFDMERNKKSISDDVIDTADIKDIIAKYTDVTKQTPVEAKTPQTSSTTTTND